MSDSTSTPQEKLALAFDMFEFGVEVMRQNLRRRFPSESDDEIEQRLVEWLHHRPGAEFGDAAGKGSLWERS